MKILELRLLAVLLPVHDPLPIQSSSARVFCRKDPFSCGWMRDCST
jgi:hypothetical protein